MRWVYPGLNWITPCAACFGGGRGGYGDWWAWAYAACREWLDSHYGRGGDRGGGDVGDRGDWQRSDTGSRDGVYRCWGCWWSRQGPQGGHRAAMWRHGGCWLGVCRYRWHGAQG